MKEQGTASSLLSVARELFFVDCQIRNSLHLDMTVGELFKRVAIGFHDETIGCADLLERCVCDDWEHQGVTQTSGQKYDGSASTDPAIDGDSVCRARAARAGGTHRESG